MKTTGFVCCVLLLPLLPLDEVMEVAITVVYTPLVENKELLSVFLLGCVCSVLLEKEMC